MSQPLNCPEETKSEQHFGSKLNLSWSVSLFVTAAANGKKHSWPVGTNLGDHGNHGTQRLLSIGVVHRHLLTEVTEKLATKHNMRTLTLDLDVWKVNERKGPQSYPNRPRVSATTSLIPLRWQNSPAWAASSTVEFVSTTTYGAKRDI